jgi:hypothetical protein
MKKSAETRPLAWGCFDDFQIGHQPHEPSIPRSRPGVRRQAQRDTAFEDMPFFELAFLPDSKMVSQPALPKTIDTLSRFHAFKIFRRIFRPHQIYENAIRRKLLNSNGMREPILAGPPVELSKSFRLDGRTIARCAAFPTFIFNYRNNLKIRILRAATNILAFRPAFWCL